MTIYCTLIQQVARSLEEVCTGLRGHLHGKYNQTDGQSLLLQLVEVHTATSTSTAPPSPAAVEPVQQLQQDGALAATATATAAAAAAVGVSKQFGASELRAVLAACSMPCTAQEVCSYFC
jgi:hypothetical protein